MICPKCKTPVTKQGRFCVKCGSDFGEPFSERLAYYFGLKDEFKRVAALQNNLASGLKDLLGRIETFEGVLSRELERSPAEPSEILGQAAGKPLEPTPAGIPVSEAIAAGTGETGPKPQPISAFAAYAAQQKRDSSAFEVQVGQKWLLIVGILTMVFGVGYFLKYSFEQGWVGPEGRVAMAYVWGILFLVAGDRFRKSFERFGLSLIGGGIAVLYFSAFAAFQLYHLFGQTASFSIMVLITVLACVLAVRYDTKWLAVLGLIGGFLTPVLLTTGQDNQIALMTYMTILNLGLLAIAFSKKWDLLNTLGFVFTYLLYSGWYLNHYNTSKFWPAILFLNVFFLIYSLVPFAYQVRKGAQSDGREILLMGLNSLIAFGYGYVMIKALYGLVWVSIISVFYAFVFLSLATWLYQKGKQSLDVFVIMLAKAMLFLIITVPVLFSGHWITLFWSAQSLALVWMASKLERRSLTMGGLALLLAAIVKFLIYDYPEFFGLELDGYFRGGYMHLLIERFVTTVLLVTVTAAAAHLLRKAPQAMQSSEQGYGPFLSLLLGVIVFIILTVETSAFFHHYLLPARFAAISVLWTLFSVVLMLLGFRKNIAVLRKVSFGLFLVVALKVFLFDMANFSTPYRIVSFIILGLVLVSTSYLYYRQKDRIIDVLAENEGTGGRRGQ